MKITSSRFGEIEINDEQQIFFKEGLLGFENLKNFVLLPVNNSMIFTWLQSTEEGEIAFLLADPFMFFPGYEVELDESIREDLQIDAAKDVVIQAIVTIPEAGVKDMTANLLGPLVINVNDRIGKQTVLTQTNYTTRHKLFEPEEGEG